MIKNLENLKCRAIAVEAAENYDWKIWGDGRTLSGLEKGIGSMSQKKYIDLPERQWKILGRVHELNKFTIDKLYNLYDESGFGVPIVDQWKEYCAANNLTNELILVESEKEGKNLQ